MIVIINLILVCLILPFNKLWWAHVTETPDVNKINVFNKGILNALKVETPVGGQIIPISILGDKLKWKNLQKKEKKRKFLKQ